jgi:hypothetical protein
MIAWKTNHRRFYFYAFTAAVENVYIDKDAEDYDGIDFPIRYRMFIQNIVIVENNEVKIYNEASFGKSYYISGRKSIEESIEKMPVVSEYTPLDDFPDKFAIRTSNIDLLRELIARGKKITWISPDIIKFASILAILPFEHLLIDQTIGRHAILPTGEAVRVKIFYASKEEFDKEFMGIWRNHVSFAREIGFYAGDLKKRINFKVNDNKSRIMFAKGERYSKNGIKFLMLDYYNILSITYMICKKSCIAMTAKKSVPKD